MARVARPTLPTRIPVVFRADPDSTTAGGVLIVAWGSAMEFTTGCGCDTVGELGIIAGDASPCDGAFFGWSSSRRRLHSAMCDSVSAVSSELRSGDFRRYSLNRSMALTHSWFCS